MELPIGSKNTIQTNFVQSHHIKAKRDPNEEKIQRVALGCIIALAMGIPLIFSKVRAYVFKGPKIESPSQEKKNGYYRNGYFI